MSLRRVGTQIPPDAQTDKRGCPDGKVWGATGCFSRSEMQRKDFSYCEISPRRATTALSPEGFPDVEVVLSPLALQGVPQRTV